MAHVAAYCCSLDHCDSLARPAFIVIILVVAQENAIRCSLGEHGAFQVPTMTGAAGIRIAFIEILMFSIPARTIDVVHAVWAVKGKRQAGMTATALADGAGMSLQLVRRHVIIGRGQCIWPDCMRGAMTTLAGDTTVTQAITVKRIFIFSKALVVCQARRGDIDITRPGLFETNIAEVIHGITGMAGLAPGFINPGFAIFIAHSKHTAMTILALDTGTAHGAPEALGDLTRMTLITGFLKCTVRREQ